MRRSIAIAPSPSRGPLGTGSLGAVPVAARAEHGPRRRSGARAHALNFSQLIGSHLGVALAGLASLPVLARNLGPAAYGHFSLFMTTLGVLSNLDLARPILVRDLARRNDRDLDAARALAMTSALALAVVAFAVGLAVQGGVTAIALSLSVLLHGGSSAAFAELSARGQVGLAGSWRNGCWAGALAVTVALSFLTATPHAYIWAFVVANLAILAGYQRLVGATLGAVVVRPRLAALRAHQRQAGDIAAFAGATAVVASADKLLLESHASADGFGHYAAQYDLATKLNIVSTALGAMLLPAFARMHEERGAEAAATRFVRVASWIALCYFVGIAALIALNEPVARLVLGADFVSAIDLRVYVLMLVGVFIHLFGFLLTAYQRACGDFRSHRVAYIGAAALMLVVGFLVIPTHGALGAVATYLCGRVAELSLIAFEARRMSPSALPRWRLAVLATMIVSLTAFAAVTYAQGGLGR